MKTDFLTYFFGALYAIWQAVALAIGVGVLNWATGRGFHASKDEVQFGLIFLIFIELYKLNRKVGK